MNVDDCPYCQPPYVWAECPTCMNCICENEFNVDCQYCNQLGMEENE